MPTEAHIKGNREWDKKHMATLGCKVKKEQAARFKQYAEERGTTGNALLKQYVLECIEDTVTE